MTLNDQEKFQIAYSFKVYSRLAYQDESQTQVYLNEYLKHQIEVRNPPATPLPKPVKASFKEEEG